MNKFLLMAEKVLENESRPLNGKEIVDIGLENSLLFTQGKTPYHTLRARLSEELLRKGSNSIFQRTAKNKFALRKWKLPEYHATRFRKDTSSEHLVCYYSSLEYFKNNSLNGIFKINNDCKKLLKDFSSIEILKRGDAEKRLDVKQLVSYVFLVSEDNEKILTYVRGKYSSAHEFLIRGKHSIGFGGHVLDKDIFNLFNQNDVGVFNSALREISEEIKGFIPNKLEIVKVIHDCTSVEGYKHIGIVLKGTISSNFKYESYKKELSINGVNLISVDELWNNFHLYEYWSQLVIKDYFKGFKPKNISKIFPNKRPNRINKFIVVGEIANGKTTLIKSLDGTFSVNYISASNCIASLLNIPNYTKENRIAFQDKAQEFISNQEGPILLAKEIVSKIDDNKLNFIDGVRNISTIMSLRELLGEIVLIYVDCPRDKAFHNFKKRYGSNFQAEKFVQAREHETERDLSLIYRDSDCILFNGDSIKETIKILKRWIN